jgi:uncharacterized membrane protein YjfL (UPF0719 family)
MVAFGGLLLGLGLILALAVQDNVSGVDLTTVGWIVASVGAILLVVGIIAKLSPRRQEQRVVEERHISDT